MSITYKPIPEWLLEEFEETVQAALTRLRIPCHLRGYRYLVHAIMLAIQDPQRLEQIMKDIYPDVARRHRSTVSRVERNMRTAVRFCWESEGRETLSQMAGYHLTERPTNSEFVEIVTRYVKKG